MKSVVYFVDGAIRRKIGCSTDLKKKLRSEYGNDPEFFGADLEAKCHLSFAGQRVCQRDWLANLPDIHAFVRQSTSLDFTVFQHIDFDSMYAQVF